MSSAAILAGGRATRFGGRDKGALVVGGRTILDRQVRELRQVADDLMLVAAAPPESAPPAGVRVVTDRVPDAGPLGGLDAALAAATHEAVLLLACDMPFVTAPLLGHLLALTGEADAVVPRTERGYHPLCAAYTRACRNAVAAHLAERRLRMIDLLAAVRVRVVSGPELEAFGDGRRLLANVNTPADYARAGADPSHEL